MNQRQYKVILPKNKRPGLLSVGGLKPGAEYSFDAAECGRLVDAHGFEFTAKADERQARAEAGAAVSVAEPAESAAPATAEDQP